MESTNNKDWTFRWLMVGLVFSAAIHVHAQTGNTALIVSGPEDDPLTLGANFYYLPKDGTFILNKLPNSLEEGIWLAFRGPNVQEQWNLMFWAPIGQVLEVADYEHCETGPTDTTGGLEVDGFGAGCSHASASFIVHELVRNVDGTIEALHISFQQSCVDSPTAALAGEIYYHSSHLLPTAPTPAPTAAPGQLSTFTVSVSPNQIMEGEDATFIFTARPPLAVRSSVGITERLHGPPINGTFGATISVQFGPGVTTRTVKLHTIATGGTGKNSQYKVSLLNIPVYKVGTPGSATVTVVRPHRHRPRN